MDFHLPAGSAAADPWQRWETNVMITLTEAAMANVNGLPRRTTRLRLQSKLARADGAAASGMFITFPGSCIDMRVWPVGPLRRRVPA